MPLFHRGKPRRIVPTADYLNWYHTRLAVPPATLYPLLHRALDLVFLFNPLSARVLMSLQADATDPKLVAKAYDAAAPGSADERREIYNVQQAIAAVRVADEHPQLIAVHGCIEQFVMAIYLQWECDATSCEAEILGDRRT